MKAIVWTKYGAPDVLQLTEVQRPIPKEDELLIKIHATTVTMGDCEMRNLKLSFFLALFMRIYNGFRKPKRITILGQDLAGEIESVGEDVKLFKKGNQIFGSAGFKMGAYAEYICLPEKGDAVLALKPINISYGEAAAIPLGGLNALYFLKRANILIGQKVLINGAGGSIGTFAVQLAKSYGAEVTGVDSKGKLEMLLSIGADKVIDYSQEDFTKNGQSYDVIFDLVRTSSYSGCINSLKKKGIYLQANHGLFRRIRGRLTSMTSSKKVIGGTISEESENLNVLKELFQDAKLKSVIDKSYPLEKVVEAHRYVETGQKKGNVVIIVRR
ncbi:MAG: NAD(P)-dependent alcohol dehydrogenase [Candidatus Lokiarchaeota archaeon]|nr:NAD(P)-dependent alcohol dehydrogenase [Candidatus Lokiarchaeota archaeon]